ncbi:MAG: SDR family oxidoreductase [Deltaproteobacteria bacterium]|nr:SDR family oxidoreductase [Deltaproteobacteria bacterium]
MSLLGRNALITGGASGIGRAIALRLARDGTDVAVLDRHVGGAQAVADEIARTGRRALAAEVDVADTASVARAVADVRATLGPIHVVVNSAGIADFAPLADLAEERWLRMLDVHLNGTYRVTRAAFADMVAAGWGRIVNVASAAALNGGGPGLAHYAAAKAGIIGFTRALAHELGPSGITVNAIAPGLVDTPLIHGAGAPAGLYDAAVARLPVRRIGQPRDIAAACAYLASEEGGFCTGQVLSPNGGAVM